MERVQKLAEYEINSFKSFLVTFNIIGLAIGTVIGLTLSESSQILTNELVMPIIISNFKINDVKNFTLSIYDIDIKIGILLSELIKIFIITTVVFFIYSFIHIYMNDILSPNYKEIEEKQVNKLNATADDTKNIQTNILTELKRINHK
tara:strand:+ start:159 stop:602 length:444 start_codon:yes stop_codon:yes gene_type:complete